MTQQLKLNSIGFALKKSQLFLQVCLQPLNKTDHWPIDTIGKSVITKNLSQKLIRRDRGKSSLEVEESKKTDFYHGETRTESLVENLEVKLGSLNDVGKRLIFANMNSSLSIFVLQHFSLFSFLGNLELNIKYQIVYLLCVSI